MSLKETLKKYSIENISFDSRKISPGSAFFAIEGSSSSGLSFISEAVKAGASLIVTESGEDFSGYKDSGIEFFKVENARKALAEAAGFLYPGLPKYLFAVTGTNGKTSTAYYIKSLASLLGLSSAFIGTIGIISDVASPIEKEYSGLTTPDALFLRKIFDDYSKKKLDCVSIEASSQGLDQERLRGLSFTAACFTSFSEDHLDYHGDRKNYLQAKLKLFRENLSKDSLIVIDSDVPESKEAISLGRKRGIEVLSVGSAGDLKIGNIKNSIKGSEFEIDFRGKKYKSRSSVIGDYQLRNISIAALALLATGKDFADILEKIPLLKAPPGRLQRITGPDSPFHIFVDYAHSPESLEKSLKELRKIIAAEGKLSVVFGCGGNRDAGKRPIMGALASALADRVIVTDDNPRFEDPAAIRAQILKQAEGALEIASREEAIENAVKGLGKGDALLVAGKGHEEFQIIGKEKIPFSDSKIVLEILGKL